MSDFDMEGKGGDGEVHELVEYGEYKGNKMIIIRRTTEDKYPLQFGITKAKMILDNIEAIEEFVAKNAKG